MLADFFAESLQRNLLGKFRAVILGHVSVSSLRRNEEDSSKEHTKIHVEDH